MTLARRPHPTRVSLSDAPHDVRREEVFQVRLAADRACMVTARPPGRVGTLSSFSGVTTQ